MHVHSHTLALLWMTTAESVHHLDLEGQSLQGGKSQTRTPGAAVGERTPEGLLARVSM